MFTTVILISFGSTLQSARCHMECRTTKPHNGSEGKRLKSRHAASVLWLAKTNSAKISVSQDQLSHPGVSTGARGQADSLMSSRSSSWVVTAHALPSLASPPLSRFSHIQARDLWSLTWPAFHRMFYQANWFQSILPLVNLMQISGGKISLFSECSARITIKLLL